MSSPGSVDTRNGLVKWLAARLCLGEREAGARAWTSLASRLLEMPEAPRRGENAIAYYRGSRQKQDASGLGLEDRQANVAAFARARGYEVTASFTEIETGTNKRQRPELASALEQARREGAELLIAKLDRLARNVHFVSGLMESRVRFTAVDMPEVDSLTVHILAAVAEKEAKMISTRTKDALTAAKARGVKLGNPQNLTLEARQRGAQARRTSAVEAYRLVSGYVQVLRSQGLTLQKIADRLNAEGQRTVTGKLWRPVQVRNVLLRVRKTDQQA